MDSRELLNSFIRRAEQIAMESRAPNIVAAQVMELVSAARAEVSRNGVLSQQAESAEPVTAMCPAACGCLWRDNQDGTMSLYGKNSQSCDVCEVSVWDELIPLRSLVKPGVPSHYAVLDASGGLEYAVQVKDTITANHAKDLCHAHINDAVLDCVEGANEWAVRPMLAAAPENSNG